MSLLLLHPIGLDGDCWQFLSESQRQEAQAFTMLWHGDRPFTNDVPSMDLFAHDVVTQTEGLLDVVGLSMGGAVAQHIAIRYPDRVRSLMICCANAGGADPTVYLQRADDVERSGIAGLLDVTLQRWFTQSSLSQPTHPGVTYVRERLLSDQDQAFAASWRALATHNCLDQLGKISAPVTVLWARDDAAVPRAAAEELANRLPRSRLVDVPGPHMVQLELPETFEEALQEHLSWVDRLLNR